jgi:hypothetical protein
VVAAFGDSQKSAGLDGHEAVQMVKLLSSRATSALEWAGTLKKVSHEISKMNLTCHYLLHNK